MSSTVSFWENIVMAASAQKERAYNLCHATERFEYGYAHNILVLAGGNRHKAAEMLGISSEKLGMLLEKQQNMF